MTDWMPQTLTASFLVAEENLGDTEDEVLAHVKDRMTTMLAHRLAKELAESPGGAIYSPVTYTIRPISKDRSGYQVVGTIQALRLPDPESNEFRLVGGPMHGAIIRVGPFAPERYPMPLVRSYELQATADPTVVIYDRIHGIQAYRWAGGLTEI
jgi:hypothetical protein